MTRTNRPDPDRLPDPTQIDSLKFTDALDEAWRRAVQLNAMLGGMVLPERVRGPSAELTRLEAAWGLSFDAVYGLGQVKEALGAPVEETGLEQCRNELSAGPAGAAAKALTWSGSTAVACPLPSSSCRGSCGPSAARS